MLGKLVLRQNEILMAWLSVLFINVLLLGKAKRWFLCVRVCEKGILLSLNK